MISQILPAAIGNALRLFLEPPGIAVSWRVLRNLSGTFIDQNDADATLIYSGSDLTYLMDAECLVNGTAYYYGVFYFDGIDWIAAPVISVVPNHTYTDQSVDVLTIVRDRLDYGLQNEIQLGRLSPSSGVIAVLNAPPMFEETNWPVVTVHVTSDGSGERGIGEQIMPDMFDPLSGLWTEEQGWLARVTLAIIGWSKNPDERIALRRALRKIVIGNLEVFDNAGFIHIDFAQQDIDELSAYPAPVYQSLCTFSCEAPAAVAQTSVPIDSAPEFTMTTAL